MSSNSNADSRTSSERSSEIEQLSKLKLNDDSFEKQYKDIERGSEMSCSFPTIEELNKFKLSDDFVEKQYKVIENLGEGGFGAVYQVQHKVDNKIYAIKIIPLQKSNDEEEIMELTREIKILSKLKHEHIVRYYTSCKLKDGDDVYFCIQMQYCKKTLRTFNDNFISTRETEKQRLQILKQIIDGLNYIHDNGIMHRDLNPNNIFLTESEIIKIGDFGSSRQTAVYCSDKADNDEVCGKKLTKSIGTLIYCAPELKSGKYDKRIDLYSLGIIIFEMFYFLPKAAESEKIPIFLDIRSQEVKIPESLEPEFVKIQDVFKGLLVHNPDYRTTLDEVADKVKQLNQFSTLKLTEEDGILRTTEVCENQQMNETTGIVLDTELRGIEMIHDENVETRSDGYAVGPHGDNGWSDGGRSINSVQDSYSEKLEKIRISKEVIKIFTGKPPKDETHISGVMKAIETFPHPNVDRDEDNNHVMVPESSTEDVGNITEYMRTRRPTDVVKSNSLEDEDSAKCKEEQQREVEECISTIEVTHATGHLPYPEPTQTVSQETTAQFHQQDVAELDSTSETEPQSSAVFSTVHKVPRSVLPNTETIETDKEL